MSNLNHEPTSMHIDHSLNNYLHLFEKHPDAIFVMNLQGNILYANQAILKLLGYSKGHLLTLRFQELVHPEEIEMFNYYLQKAAEGDIQELVTTIKCNNGKKIEVQIITVSNEIDGQIASISGYITETTDLTNNMGVSQRPMELCESFIENNRDPILLLDLEATIVLANNAFSQLLGWRKENLEGFHILQCPSIPPHLIEQMRNYYNRVLNHEPNLTMLETIRITTDGKAHHMMLTITPIYDHSGQACNWAVHLRDITSQIEAEQSLLQADKLLAIGRFAANVSQEMKDPLTMLQGFIQMIKNSKKGSGQVAGYLEGMVKELNRIESFVEDLSLLAKPQIQSYKYTNICDLIKGAIHLAKTQAFLNNVQVEFVPIAIPTIWAEEQQLKQAFFNIIQNGIEAMPDGGILRIDIKSTEDYLHINVVDQGVGIPEEYITKLGEPIYSENENRIGLGLTLTYKIIKQHHGKISVQSKVEKGTQFMVELPIVNQDIKQTG